MIIVKMVYVSNEDVIQEDINRENNNIIKNQQGTYFLLFFSQKIEHILIIFFDIPSKLL